jgi:hypothetical protein
MSPSRLVLFLVLLAFCDPVRAAEETVTYYVQAIRGTNSDQPPTPDAKAIGPKLSGKLAPVFRWKNYWEVKRLNVVLTKGKTERVKLPGGLEVEVARANEDKREVLLYRDGRLTRKVTQPANKTMTIIGGMVEPDNSWFVVVRRDKPSIE